jgi:AbrB family looped-hinge helix DNA binding protein
MAQSEQVRVREHGQVTIPARVRQRLGLKTGDILNVVDTPDGILIVSPEARAIQVLDDMGAIPREQGATLEDGIETSRTGRGQVIHELYGRGATLGSVAGVVIDMFPDDARPHFTITSDRGDMVTCYVDNARQLQPFAGTPPPRLAVAGTVTRDENGRPSVIDAVHNIRLLGQQELPRVADLVGIDPNLTGDQTTDDWLEERRQRDDEPATPIF